MGLNPDFKSSNIPEDLIMNFRNLICDCYNLSDTRAAYALKLGAHSEMFSLSSKEYPQP